MPDRLPEIIRRIGERFEREVPEESVGDVWTATELLLGLRYDKDEAHHLLRGVKGMRESSTYQAILEDGRDEGREQGRLADARQIVLELGTGKLGHPMPPLSQCWSASTIWPCSTVWRAASSGRRRGMSFSLPSPTADPERVISV